MGLLGEGQCELQLEFELRQLMDRDEKVGEPLSGFPTPPGSAFLAYVFALIQHDIDIFMG